MNTQDAIRIADLETAETRNRRGWTPDEIRRTLAVHMAVDRRLSLTDESNPA